jgi:hypothetical protein
MNPQENKKNADEKDQEWHEQQERGAKIGETLKDYDKTDADSFPASDPPPHP